MSPTVGNAPGAVGTLSWLIRAHSVSSAKPSPGVWAGGGSSEYGAVGSALRSGRRGRRFESSYSDRGHGERERRVITEHPWLITAGPVRFGREPLTPPTWHRGTCRGGHITRGEDDDG